jgi:hypothetical protein
MCDPENLQMFVPTVLSITPYDENQILRDKFCLKNSEVKRMKDIISAATLAVGWGKEVDRKMEKHKKEIPLLLSSFYTIAPTEVDFENTTPFIQLLLQESRITGPVEKYLKTKEPEALKPLPPRTDSGKDKPRVKWDTFNPADETIPLEQFFEFDAFDWNFPMLSLFTHIGIRIPVKDKDEGAKDEFCLWPACQPNVNNRQIPMEWIWDYETRTDKAIVRGILERGDLAWTGQKVFFLPYTVKCASETKDEGEAQMSSVIADTTSVNDNVEADGTGAQDEPKFDGDLRAKLASAQSASEAFEALSVSLSLARNVFDTVIR